MRLAIGLMAVIMVLVGLMIASRNTTAHVSLPSLTDFQVLTEDHYYGDFDRIEIVAVHDGYQRVRLERDFISDSSLSFWAQERGLKLREPQDIKLVVTRGEHQVRYLLEKSLPLAWSLHASASRSGYHESIELAVHKISSLP